MGLYKYTSTDVVKKMLDGSIRFTLQLHKKYWNNLS
jgi:hypothetical protein